MAHTYASTSTYIRVLFLQKQIREILLQTTQISEYKLDRLLEAVKRKWIRQIDIYALNHNNLCQAKIVVDIDWNEHERQISVGKITVAIDNRWKNDLLPQTDATIWAFTAYVNEFDLRTEWRVSYTNWVYDNSNTLSEARDFLGTSPAKPVKWAGKTIDEYVKNQDFPEFGIGLYFVE